jgi:hypothetical protein
MRVPPFLPLLLLVPLAIGEAAPTPSNQDDGFVPMWNGKDLTGWVNVNCAPETFFIKEDMIITTGKPTGYLRTSKQYENFIAEFDWMHVPPSPKAVGNSGFFVWADPIPAVGTGYTRGIEVQVLVNLEYKDNKTGAVTATSHGDLFAIWGANCVPDRAHPLGWPRCLPSENNCKGANEWNHYRVEAKDGVIKLTVNGKLVSGVSKCSPRKGYLGLEAEGSECRFKNLKIKELPTSNPTAAETADVAIGFESLFTGLDLRGWQADDEHKKHWKTRGGWGLVYDGKCPGDDPHLWTAKEYGDFEMIVDWRLPAKQKKKDAGKGEGDETLVSGILLRGSDEFMVGIGQGPLGSGELRCDRLDPILPKEKADRPAGEWNRFRIRVKGDKVSVFLNGKQVADETQLPGMPEQGGIGLQHVGQPMEFGNLFVRELGNED